MPDDPQGFTLTPDMVERALSGPELYFEATVDFEMDVDFEMSVDTTVPAEKNKTRRTHDLT